LRASPVWALIVANAVPLAGALFLGWELAPILALYWAESAVIGCVTVLRILTNRTGPWPAKLLAAPMFCVHFGLFMFVHGTFLSVALSGDRFGASAGPAGLLHFFEEPGLWWTLVALTGSHVWSFAVHDLAGGERDRIPVARQMFRPYARIIVMHLTLILGLGFTFVFGDSWALAALFVVFKTVADVAAHRRSHRLGPADAELRTEATR